MARRRRGGRGRRSGGRGTGRPGAGLRRIFLLTALVMVGGGAYLGVRAAGNAPWAEADPVRTLEREDAREEEVLRGRVEGRAPDERVRVEVLNAGGIPGMAARARQELRERGFDVVYYGNAPSFGREESLVLDRAGRDELAASVARALGIESTRSEPDPGLLLEVTVLLGRDWQPLGEILDMESAESTGERAPWIGRWLERIRARPADEGTP